MLSTFGCISLDIINTFLRLLKGCKRISHSVSTKHDNAGIYIGHCPQDRRGGNFGSLLKQRQCQFQALVFIAGITKFIFDIPLSVIFPVRGGIFLLFFVLFIGVLVITVGIEISCSDMSIIKDDGEIYSGRSSNIFNAKLSFVVVTLGKGGTFPYRLRPFAALLSATKTTTIWQDQGYVVAHELKPERRDLVRYRSMIGSLVNNIRHDCLSASLLTYLTIFLHAYLVLTNTNTGSYRRRRCRQLIVVLRSNR
mmetsp:Transcript_5654/g.13562  ORF Transcript_5654/g.13562 Transcript_5654/m.13562 type:complete len:252 (-) Transcript_5654:494-1249(-)